jgi:hypothetical protein
MGWRLVHVAIDDATRLSYAEVLHDEQAITTVGFLSRAIALFEGHGMKVRELLIENGSSYRLAVRAVACRTLGVLHVRPQTNGKACILGLCCRPGGRPEAPRGCGDPTHVWLHRRRSVACGSNHRQAATLIVGVAVHKHNHAGVLIDNRGGEIATSITPEGHRSLIDRSVESGTAKAVIGVESTGSYGSTPVTAVAGGSFEVLQVPAWRTHRGRHRCTPGKTDPGNVLSIVYVVRRKPEELGLAEEPSSSARLEWKSRRAMSTPGPAERRKTT